MKRNELVTYSELEGNKTVSYLAKNIMIELGLKDHENNTLILYGINLLVMIATSNIEQATDGTKSDLMKNEIAEISKLEKKLSEIKKIRNDLRYYKGEKVREQWSSIDTLEKDLTNFKLKHR